MDGFVRNCFLAPQFVQGRQSVMRSLHSGQEKRIFTQESLPHSSFRAGRMLRDGCPTRFGRTSGLRTPSLHPIPGLMENRLLQSFWMKKSLVISPSKSEHHNFEFLLRFYVIFYGRVFSNKFSHFFFQNSDR